MKVYLGFTSLSLMSFAFSLLRPGGSAKIFQLAGLYGIKCFVSIGFLVVYQYAIEIYPTESRTTGVAITIGSGRLAGIISPLVIEAIVSVTGGFSAFFFHLGLCYLVEFLARSATEV